MPKYPSLPIEKFVSLKLYPLLLSCTVCNMIEIIEINVGFDCDIVKG